MTRGYKSSSPEEFRSHNEKLQVEVEKQGIDMLLPPTPKNIYCSTGYRSWYASGFFRPVYVPIPREGNSAIILGILEKTTVQYASWASRIYCWGTASRNPESLEGVELVNVADRIIKEIQPDTGTIGLETENGMQYPRPMELLKKIINPQPGICFTDDSLTIQRVRMVKTPWEVERIRHVYRITEKATLDTGKTIVAGEATGKDISKGITMRMTQSGVDKTLYLTVTSGVDKYCTFNTYVANRVVQKGEYALVSISSHIDGYAPSLTRVFYLRTMPREEREMAETASGCVATAKEVMKPGAPMADINCTCEGYIRDSRLGRLLLHSNGHYAGPNAVEYPTTHDETGEKLKPDMVFIVENGIYPYNLEGGVESVYLSFRTKDEVLVIGSGAKWITGLEESVTEMGADKQVNSIL